MVPELGAISVKLQILIWHLSLNLLPTGRVSPLDEPERIRTLLSVDLVNLSDAGKELKNYILSKGIVIYDRSIKI